MADNKLVSPDRTIPVSNRGIMENRFANWTEETTNRINTSVIEGDGSPEGAVNARRLTFYYDRTNENLYIKSTNLGDSTGWKLV